MKTVNNKNQRKSKKAGATDVTRREDTASHITNSFYTLFNDVKIQFKIGIFDKSLLGKVKELHKIVDENSKSLRNKDELSFWKSKAFMSEVYDCFGLIVESQQVAEEGKDIFNNLPVSIEKNISIESRKLLQEKIRFCLSWAIAYFYRTRQHRQAEDIVSRIHDLVLKELRSDSLSCNGTLGHISYYRGKIYRQLGRFDEASIEFANAISYYDERGAQKKIEFADKPERAAIENKFVVHRAAICLGLGLGWINYTRADLKTSLHSNIVPAHLMFLNTGDELNRAALDNIRGAITRSLARKGHKREILSSVKYIQSAYEVFKGYEHRRYEAWAAFNLSLSYYYVNDFKAAGVNLRKAYKIARKLNDIKWKSRAITLYSRILGKLNKHEKAEAMASRALNMAKDANQVLCEIDALIWRGVARIDLHTYSDARIDLENALNLNKQRQDVRRNVETANPRIEALCHIYIARSYALERERLKAELAFQKWKNIEKEVEDQRVHYMADRVLEVIENLQSDFIIEKIDPDSPRFQREKMISDNLALQKHLNYDANRRRLQKFLVKQAKNISEDKQDIAKLLGISRQTLFQWENGWKNEKRVITQK